MAITVIQAPSRVQFSRNPITLVLLTTEILQPNIRVFLEVQFWNPATSVFDAVATVSTRPDSTGQCVFELEDTLDSAAAPWLPVNPAGLVNRGADQYRLRWWESYGTPPVAQPSNVSATYNVLRGGLPLTSTTTQRDEYYQGWPRNVLTTMPLSRRTHPDTPQFMYFVTSPRAEVQNVRLRIVVDTPTGQQVFFRYLFELTGSPQILRIKTDWASLDIPTINFAEVISYTVYLVQQTNLRVSQAITYIPDIHCCEVRHFVYENSLGGFDSLYSTAWDEKGFEVARDIAEMYRPFNYTIKGAERYNLGSQQHYNARNRMRISTATGYKSVEEADAHRDMLISRAVYEYMDGEYYPIIITTTAIEPQPTREALYGFPFEYEYAFSYDTIQTDLNIHKVC